VGASKVVHLPCAPASVSLARQVLTEELLAAGIFDYAVNDAALVISELLSNAILHAFPLPGEQLQVAWSVNGTTVEVAVSDGGSATMPHAGHPSPASVSGRGLSIVEHVAQTWGVRHEAMGLTVWAILAAPRNQRPGGQHNGDGPSGSPGLDGAMDRVSATR
jgi:anti-sigma regulatory factor (Ser/Thr protein kinase)